jgi:hypothetical protein
VEHVVETPELARALEREDVERLLDDAQPEHVAGGVPADRAEGRVADVEAALAEHDLLPHRDQCLREGACLCLGRAQEVIGEALRGLGADAGQAREGVNEPGDRLDQESGHAREAERTRSRAAACRR